MHTMQQKTCLMAAVVFASCRLTYLSLADNRLQGRLDQANWTAAPLLRFLNLSSNMLTGPLPASWSAFRANISIDVSRNRLSGSLPPAWSSAGADGMSMQLTLLNASTNLLSGECLCLLIAFSRQQVTCVDIGVGEIQNTL